VSETDTWGGGGVRDGAEVLILPPILMAIQVVAAELAHLVWPLHLATGWRLRFPLAAAALVVSAVLMAGAFRLFQRMGQNPDPTTATPAITRAGPYRFTRNPMYVAGGLLQIALALARDNAWILIAALPGFAIMQWGVIWREEAYLERKFGDEYRAYKAAVRRWL
jgi:protein-S-isoprenylcysteine O-methyltransferase Ste14